MKHFTNEELNQHMKSLACQYNALTAEVVRGIREVLRRELYLEMGYPSIFAYLTEYAGFSNCVAQRNLDAARISLEVPSVVESIHQGNLNLTQINLVQKAARQLEREGRPITKEKKQEVLKAIENTPARKSEHLIAKALDIKIQEHTKIQTQADESVRITMTFTNEEWQQIQETLNKKSHQVPSGDVKDLFVLLTNRPEIRTKNRTETATATETVTETATETETETETETSTIVVNNSITPKMRAEMLKKHPCCQYRDRKTGKQCKTQWQRQVDHIIPIWAGGTNEPKNLQVLCRKHNAWKYRQEAGIRRCHEEQPPIGEKSNPPLSPL